MAVTTSSFGSFLLLLVCASLVKAQTTLVMPNTTTGAGSPGTDDVCSEIGRLSDEIDSLVFSSEGLGGPLPVDQVDWTKVQTYLAPNFTWNDYSAFGSGGNYSDYRTFWEAVNMVSAQYPLQNGSTEQWTSCDPVALREISQWREPFASASDPTRQEVSTSIYIIEFDSDLKATRQAYWTSGNLANLVRGQS